MGQHRRVDHLAQTLGLRRGLLGFGDDEGLALAGARDAFDQMPVHAAADAEREHVAVVQVLADQLRTPRLDVT